MNKTKRVIALGFFDGVHTGHGALLQRVTQRARELDAIPTAFTFDRSPTAAITGQHVPLLSSVEDRVWLMRSCYHIQEVIVSSFDGMMRMDWQDFITEYLVREIEREGITISSTYIRTLVAQGEMDRAVEFLGHPHVLTNRVTHGKKIGSSSLGFPTVNLQVPPQVIVPAFGVYATRVWVEGRSYIAVTNVGVRPTVEDNDGRVTVEGFILDFDGDLYGKELRMEFYHRIRGEQKFPSLQELSQEIRRNAEETRAYFLAASQDAPGAR